MSVTPPLETPVAFFVFNRPGVTRRVFDAIAAARPRRLLVVADGPRADRPGEAERCAAVREIVARVDWDCTVVREYAEGNLGCRARVSSGLDRVFGEFERAIILEDDCLPDPTFFRYCEELLERYAADERVTMISGNAHGPPPSDGASYRFSRYNLIWGWASWRRAWRHYDVGIGRWPALRDTPWLRRATGSADIEAYWREVFDRVHRGEVDTWDYQWTFSSWERGGVAIHPRANLISNLGFGPDATHTLGESVLAEQAMVPMRFPLVHPSAVTADVAADERLAREVYQWVRESRSRALARRLGSRLRALARRARPADPGGAAADAAAGVVPVGTSPGRER